MSQPRGEDAQLNDNIISCVARKQKIETLQQYITSVSSVVDVIESNRHLLPAADAYRESPTVSDSELRSSAKSQFITELENLSGVRSDTSMGASVRPSCIFVDIMNCLHYRGVGGPGPMLEQVVQAKLQTVLNRYLTGSQCSDVQEVHLAINIARLAVKHKTAKQKLRDFRRSAKITGPGEEGARLQFYKPSDSIEDVPWNSLLMRGVRKYQLATYHLFLGGVVSAEQSVCRARQGQPSWKVVLRGGAFILSKSVLSQPGIVQDLRAVFVPDSEFVLLCKSEEDELQVLASGAEKEAPIGSLLTEDSEISTCDSGGLNYPVPLGCALIIDQHGIVSVSSEEGAYHGEAETMVVRMLCTNANCIIPRDVGNCCRRPGRDNVPSDSTATVSLANRPQPGAEEMPGASGPDSQEAGTIGATGTASGSCVGTKSHTAQAQFSMQRPTLMAANSSLARSTASTGSLPLSGNALSNSSVTTCLIDSADADVLMIILCCWHNIPSSVQGGIVFKMGQKCLLVKSIVEAAAAQKSSLSPMLLAVASCAAGGDFTPGTNGVSHKFYLRAA